MRRIWPDPGPLDADAVRDAYAIDRAGAGTSNAGASGADAGAPDARASVRVNFVTSLDGAAEVDGYTRGLSGEADVRVFGLLRMHSDAVMVGAGTLRHESYHALRLDPVRRAWRREHGLPSCPTLVIVSGGLGLDPTGAVFTDAPVRPVVLTHADSPDDRRAALDPVADVVVCGGNEVDIAAAMRELHTRGLSQVLCEGGPRLFGALVGADLVDELCLTVSPLLVGAGPPRIVAGPPGAAAGVPMRRDMRLVHILAEGDMLLTRYARA